MTSGFHLHVPSAGVGPEKLVFKVPETRLLWKPHNPVAPAPH